MTLATPGEVLGQETLIDMLWSSVHDAWALRLLPVRSRAGIRHAWDVLFTMLPTLQQHS